MKSEYREFYKAGPKKVHIITKNIRTGMRNGHSANLQLEGILSGETEDNLIFNSLRPINISNYIKNFSSKKALIRKDEVGVLYVPEQ